MEKTASRLLQDRKRVLVRSFLLSASYNRRVIPEELRHVLDSDPEYLSGAVRFVGTRVPVQALIDTLDGGDLEEFLDGWPDVTREQAETVIRWEQNQARRVFGLALAA